MLLSLNVSPFFKQGQCDLGFKTPFPWENNQLNQPRPNKSAVQPNQAIPTQGEVNAKIEHVNCCSSCTVFRSNTRETSDLLGTTKRKVVRATHLKSVAVCENSLTGVNASTKSDLSCLCLAHVSVRVHQTPCKTQKTTKFPCSLSN